MTFIWQLFPLLYYFGKSYLEKTLFAHAMIIGTVSYLVTVQTSMAWCACWVSYKFLVEVIAWVLNCNRKEDTSYMHGVHTDMIPVIDMKGLLNHTL